VFTLAGITEGLPSGTRLATPEARATFPGSITARDLPLALLQSSGHLFAHLLGPLALAVIQGSLLLSGLELPENGRLASGEEGHGDILAAADLELRLERVRRDTAPDAPSRLTCCVLDPIPDGNVPSGVVVTVETVIRELVVFPAWLEGNVLTLSDADLANYWLGQPKNGSANQAQILFDGLLIT
jgi:hypothetical protein